MNLSETPLRVDCYSPTTGTLNPKPQLCVKCGVKIFVITSFKDTCYIQILPKVEKSEPVLCSHLLELLGRSALQFNLSTRRFACRDRRMMNFAASLSKRVNLRELLHEVLVYSSATDASGGAFGLLMRRWATKKTGGSSKNGRDSNPKYLGVKKFGGERVIPGNIIVRQRGTRFHPGDYVGIGKDHTLFAMKEGKVKFETHKLSGRKWVHVEPLDGHVLHPVYSSSSGSTQMNEAM